MTDPETIYRYPDGTRQRLGASLDDVPVANATERTAPKADSADTPRMEATRISPRWLSARFGPATVPVDRAALVALLDAWQAHCDAELPSLTEPAGYVEVERRMAWEALVEALGAFAEGVDL